MRSQHRLTGSLDCGRAPVKAPIEWMKRALSSKAEQNAATWNNALPQTGLTSRSRAGSMTARPWSQRKATEMQSSKIPALLVLVAAALAGCQAETNLSPGQTLAPTGGWITPDPVHSTSDSGSVSDAASGSMVFEGQRR